MKMNSLLKLILSATLVLSVTSCGTDAPSTTAAMAAPTSPESPDALAARLETTMKGFAWFSETAAPWKAFTSNHTVQSMDDLFNLRRAFGAKDREVVYVFSPIETKAQWTDLVSLVDARGAEAKWSRAYAELRSIMEQRLRDIRFVKVGEPAGFEFALYVLGVDQRGRLVGLKTTSVEN